MTELQTLHDIAESLRTALVLLGCIGGALFGILIALCIGPRRPI